MEALDKAIKACDVSKPFKHELMYTVVNKEGVPYGRASFTIQGTNKSKIKSLFEQQKRKAEAQGHKFSNEEVNKFYKHLESYQG